MSKVDELIEQLCPEGVERKTLGELGKFYSGLTGKSKDDFTDGNAKFITYKNVYSNPALDIHPEETVKIAEGEKQRTLQYGDIIFTGSSETPDECGFASVVTEEPDEDLYLNSFCFFLRMDDKNILNPDFAKHLFRCRALRAQIGKTASGVTRFNVSKKLMEKVVIPIPPLPVQKEIVRILDNFTDLTAQLQADLTAELQARAKQYDYYKNKLFEIENVNMIPLGECCVVQAGGTPSKKELDYWTNGTVKWLSSTVCKNKKSVDEVTDYITELGLQKSSAKMMKPGTTLIALVGATIGKTAYLEFDAAINQNVAGIYPLQTDKLDPSYLYYACSRLYEQFLGLSNGKLAMANMSFVRSLKIPVPDINTQKLIAKTLDDFELICSSLNVGLPAEIEARQKQYEYYRNKLLTFKRKDVL